MGVSRKEASGRRDKGESGLSKEAQDQVINNGHVVSGRRLFEAGLVFVQGHISGIMQGIFDPPVGTQHLQEVGGRGLFRC